MRAEETKAVAERALEELALALDDGHSESLREFLKIMGKFHRYSVGNQLLISVARPDATHVAGFQAWKRLGRWVKQGEHGIMIVAPIVGTRRQNDEAEEENQRHVVFFKGCRVFDISQTDGKPLPEFAQVSGDPAEYLDRLKDFVASHGIGLTYAALPSALGVSAGGRIILRTDLGPAEEFSTLVHECAHELLHRTDDAPESRTVRELEAEAVAFVVCQAIGLECGSAASDYIQLYQGDRKLLMASLERIRGTAVEIINGLNLERRNGIQGAAGPETSTVVVGLDA